MEKINLYVDNYRICPKGFVCARSYDDVVYFLNNYNIGIISIDDDLGYSNMNLPSTNGDDVINYFCKHGFSAEGIYLHTDNPIARRTMFKKLKNYKKSLFLNRETEIYFRPFVHNERFRYSYES